MSARGKDEVLPQPDGSIVSGGTVATSYCDFEVTEVLTQLSLVHHTNYTSLQLTS